VTLLFRRGKTCISRQKGEEEVQFLLSYTMVHLSYPGANSRPHGGFTSQIRWKADRSIRGRRHYHHL